MLQGWLSAKIRDRRSGAGRRMGWYNKYKFEKRDLEPVRMRGECDGDKDKRYRKIELCDGAVERCLFR